MRQVYFTDSSRLILNIVLRLTISRYRCIEKQVQKVYFILEETSRKIKIGKSKNPSERFRMIQTGHSKKLKLLATYPEDIEEKLHELFKPYHIRGEWFDFCPEIEEWITNNCLKEKKMIILNNKLDYWLK